MAFTNSYGALGSSGKNRNIKFASLLMNKCERSEPF